MTCFYIKCFREGLIFAVGAEKKNTDSSKCRGAYIPALLNMDTLKDCQGVAKLFGVQILFLGKVNKMPPFSENLVKRCVKMKQKSNE